MGLFSGIGHLFKGILHGVKSAFKWVGKVLNSKLGHIVMLAAGVFTAGVALAAGIGAFAASSGGFLSSVVSGGQAFVTALAHPIMTSEAMMNGGVEAAGLNAAQGVSALSGAAADSSAAGATVDAGAATTDTATAANTAAGGGAADSYGLATGTSPTTGAAAPAAGAAATGPGVAPLASTAAKSGGLLSKAASSPLAGYGLMGAGNLLSGWAQGAAAEKNQEMALAQENYYGNLWNPVMHYNGNVGGAGVVSAAGGAPNAPNPGYLSMAQNIAGFMGGKAGGGYGAPNIQPGAPTKTPVSPVAPTGPTQPTTTGA